MHTLSINQLFKQSPLFKVAPNGRWQILQTLSHILLMGFVFKIFHVTKLGFQSNVLMGHFV
jgi:hypothetical protein